MIWFVTEEGIYYDKDKTKSRKRLVSDALRNNPDLVKQELWNRCKTLMYAPSLATIQDALNKGTIDVMTTAIVSPQSPTDFNFLSMGFFTEIILRGRYFPYTREQRALNIEKAEVISKRTGLKIVTPNTTMDDMAGADVLRDDILRMLLLEKQGMYTISGIFLFGVAGAGKTYFSECFAGTTGRHFVILDLPYFMSLPSPTRALDEVFDFLLSQKGESFLMLIDEIEKMFDFSGGNLVATQVFGKLLTRLNDIYSLPDNNITFVATANNITAIMSNNPEFLRKGRFNRLYFMNYPTLKSAESIFNVYKSKNKKRIVRAFKKQYEKRNNPSMTMYFDAIDKGTLNLEELIEFFYFDFDTQKVVTSINEFYSNRKQSGRSFIYVPPEIQAVAEELQNEYVLHLLEDENRKEITIERIKDGEKIMNFDIFNFTAEIARTIVPLQVSAAEGVGKQLAQAQSFGKGEQIQQFIEVS